MAGNREIFKQAGIYAFSAQATQLITLIASILSRRFLGPLQVGIWATLQIIVEYAKYSNLGAVYSVAREVPYYIGKGQKKIAEEIQNIVFTTTFTSSSVIAFGIIAYALLFRNRLSREISYGLFFVAAIVILQRMNDLLISLLRSYKQFTLASKQILWSAVVNVVLVGAFTYYYKIYGFMWAIGLSLLFNIAYILVKSDLKLRFHFEPKRFKSIITFSFPLLLIGILTTIFRSIDRILVAKLMGFKALGFYSIGMMVCSYLSTIANSSTIVLVPHLQEKFGNRDDPRDLNELLHKAGYILSFTLPILIGSAWILIPIFVSLLLPQFIPAVPAVQYLSLSVFSITLSQPYSDFLITIKKHILLFPILGISSLCTFLLFSWLIKSGYGIEWVAATVSAANLVVFSVIYFVSAKYLANRALTLKSYLINVGCFAYLLIVLYLINFLFISNNNLFLVTALKLIVFYTAFFPLLLILNRKFHLLQFVKSKLQKRLPRQINPDTGISPL